MTIYWDETQLDEQPEVLVEGDSWVSYWIPPDGNLVDRFDDIFESERVILSLAYPGDEAIRMMEGATRWAFEQSLKDYSMLKMIIFSGGGNDIAAKKLMTMLSPDCSKAKRVQQCFRAGQPEARIRQIEKAYRDLITMRDTYRPDAVIVTHNYDYPAIGKKLLWIAWLDPYMQLAKVPRKFRAGIVARFIDGFGEMLNGLQGPGFEFVKTSGTLGPSDWANELHPNRKGFKKIGKLFEPVLLKYLPNE